MSTLKETNFDYTVTGANEVANVYTFNVRVTSLLGQDRITRQFEVTYDKGNDELHQNYMGTRVGQRKVSGAYGTNTRPPKNQLSHFVEIGKFPELNIERAEEAIGRGLLNMCQAEFGYRRTSARPPAPGKYRDYAAGLGASK